MSGSLSTHTGFGAASLRGRENRLQKPVAGGPDLTRDCGLGLLERAGERVPRSGRAKRSALGRDSPGSGHRRSPKDNRITIFHEGLADRSIVLRTLTHRSTNPRVL